jgi:sensor histidine kinase YesM
MSQDLGVGDEERKGDLRARAILVGLFFSIFAAGAAIIALFVPEKYHLVGAVITLTFDAFVLSVYWVRKFSRTVDDRILATAGQSGGVTIFIMMFLLLLPPDKSPFIGLPENQVLSYFLLIASPASLAVASLTFEIASYHYGKLDKASIQRLGGLSEDFERRYPLRFNAKRPLGRVVLAMVVTAYFLALYNLMYVVLYKSIQGTDILVLSGLIASISGVLIVSKVSFIRSLFDSLDKGGRPPAGAGSTSDYHSTRETA